MAKKTNCIKNGIPYYRISAVIGYDEKGRSKRKEFYGTCKADAEQQRDKFMNGIKNGLSADANKMTLGQLCKIWIYEVKRSDSNLKPNSFSRYEMAYRNYIKYSELSAMQIINIKSLHIQRYLNNLNDSGKSYSQIKYAYKVLKMFLKYCRQEGYLINDPCLNVTIPGEKPESHEIEVFTEDEIKNLLTSLKRHRLRFLFILAIGTGMRLGELLALRYSDIYNDMIHVSRSLTPVVFIDKNGNRQTQLTFQEPKSGDSIRDIPLSKQIRAELEIHKTKQSKERLSIGLGRNDSDLIFTTETGNLFDRTNLRKTYQRILRNVDISYKKFHAFRHTFATRLLQNGTDIKTVQELMGHSDVTITMIYLHSDNNSKRMAIDTLGAYLDNSIK